MTKYSIIKLAVFLPFFIYNNSYSQKIFKELKFSIQSDTNCLGEINSISKIHHFKSSKDGAKFKAIEYDLGASTDIQPRKGLYFVFNKASEMSNTFACFHIGHFFWSIEKHKRVSAGIYEFNATVLNYDDFEDFPEGLIDVKIIINTLDTWLKDDQYVKDSKYAFADGPISSKIDITIELHKNQ